MDFIQGSSLFMASVGELSLHLVSSLITKA